MHAADHADATQLIALGGNSSTKLATLQRAVRHSSPEGQVEILRHLAAMLGYRIERDHRT